MLRIAFLIFAVVASCAVRGEEVTLAENGRACADIVIASNATAVATFAAADLKWHLDKMTGGDFKIVTEDAAARPGAAPYQIRVGATKGTKVDVSGLGRQEFVVDVRADALELVGIDSDRRTKDVPGFDAAGQTVGREGALPRPYEPCSTTYAVYELLENRLGVRWLDATDYGTVVPSRPTLKLAVGRTRRKPHFRFRGGTFQHGCNFTPWGSGRLAIPDEKVGYSNYNHFAFGGRGQQAANRAARLFVVRHRAFGEQGEANHSFYDWYGRFWDKDDPKNKNFVKYRPELFAKIPFGKPGQLCYSNPETIAQAVADVRAYFDGPPEKRRWGLDICCLEPMDNCSFCECENCRPQYEMDRWNANSAHSTYWFRFVNAVAREIRKSHPWARLSTLAYWSHEGLPTGFRLEDNVVVYFCLFENRQPFHKDYRKQFDRMRDWCREYPDRPFAMWLYNTFPTEHYHNNGVIGVPGFFAAEAERQFDFFRSYDFTGGIFHCGMVGTVDSYLQFEWMVDPALRAKAMLDDFFAAYGKAAKPLREFYELVEERYCSPAYRAKGVKCTSPECNWAQVCPPEVVDRLGRLMDEAERAAEGDAFAQARVRLFRLENWEYMLAGVRQYALYKDAPLPNWTAQRVPEAAGDLAKVPWDRLKAVRHDMYFAGAKDPTGLTGAFRFANDSTHLYLEVELDVVTKFLMNDAEIAYCDDLELYFYAGYGNMYRTYFSSPDGRICAGDFGGGVWNRRPAGDLAPAFGARCESDTSRDGVWRTRYAFPLVTLVDHPLRGGEHLRLNITSVLNPKHVGGRRNKHAILTATPFSGLRDICRIGEVHLAQ